MDISRVVILLFCLIAFAGCQSSSVIRKDKLSLELKEIEGIKKFKSGDYSEAFELLETPATWGYKGAQYAVAFMFLKGYHVEQSTLLGMGWLGVATEVETEDWSNQYRALYSSATPEMQRKIDNIVKEYVRRYGMKAQHITCSKSPTTRTRAVRHVCTKSDDLSIVYPMDLVE